MCISDLRLSFCQPQCDPGQTETEPCPQGAQAEGEDEAQVPAVKGETIRGLIRKVPLRSARARIQAETMVKAEVLSARLGLRLGVCAEIEHSSGVFPGPSWSEGHRQRWKQEQVTKSVTRAGAE